MAIPYGVDVPAGQLLIEIEDVDDDAIAYTATAGRLTPATPVTLVQDEADAPSGLDYLLEVFLIKEVLQVWSEWREGAEPDAAERCEAVQYYATHDAYLPVPGS
ncbi:hypothetical protein [Streptomyces sp. NPDC002851]